jgi:hypothetical protein
MRTVTLVLDVYHVPEEITTAEVLESIDLQQDMARPLKALAESTDAEIKIMPFCVVRGVVESGERT